MGGLQLFQQNSQAFKCPFIIADKTWMYRYTPDIKEQSKQ